MARRIAFPEGEVKRAFGKDVLAQRPQSTQRGEGRCVSPRIARMPRIGEGLERAREGSRTSGGETEEAPLTGSFLTPTGLLSS